MAGFGSVTWREFQPIVVDAVQGKKGWTPTLKLGSRRILRFPEENTSDVANEKVAEFVRALNWQMGVPTLMTNGLLAKSHETH